jgi:hypothetical protein
MNPADDPTTLGALLVAAGLITPSQLEAALSMKRVMNKVPLGQIFVRFGGEGQPFPQISEHQIEVLLAEQDHGRANKRPIGEKDAARRAMSAARASLAATTRTLAENEETSRKITLNEDLGPIDASQHVGDE